MPKHVYFICLFVLHFCCWNSLTQLSLQKFFREHQLAKIWTDTIGLLNEDQFSSDWFIIFSLSVQSLKPSLFTFFTSKPYYLKVSLLLSLSLPPDKALPVHDTHISWNQAHNPLRKGQETDSLFLRKVRLVYFDQCRAKCYSSLDKCFLGAFQGQSNNHLDVSYLI